MERYAKNTLTFRNANWLADVKLILSKKIIYVLHFLWCVTEMSNAVYFFFGGWVPQFIIEFNCLVDNEN
jgi:hypothetical protein